MSVQALNHVRKLRAGGFAQGVLLYLAMCHNGETGQCNPTRENIREFFSCDVKRVDRALSALKQAGLIVSIKKPSREGVSNWYVFPNLEGSPKNGIDPKTVGTPQNGNRVAPKMGATGSPQNGEGKSNKKSKEKEECSFSSLPTSQHPENGVNLTPENGGLTGNKQGNNKECICALKTEDALKAEGAPDNGVTVHQMHRAQNAPCTKCTTAVHDVHPQGAFNAPITDKNRQEQISSVVPACETAACPTVDDIPADVFGPDPNIVDSNPFADDESVKPAKNMVHPENEGVPAPKLDENGINTLISNGNTVAASMCRNPADGDCKNADNQLNQKENWGAALMSLNTAADDDRNAGLRSQCNVSPQTSAPEAASLKSQRARSATGTRFDLESLPEEWRRECERIQPRVDPLKVFDDFHDYWVAVPGSRGRKTDWLATWRNWVRRINESDMQRVGKFRSSFSVPKLSAPVASPEPPQDNTFRVKHKPVEPTKKELEDAEARRFFEDVLR